MNKNSDEKERLISGVEAQEEQSLKMITTVVYALQAASFFIGLSFIAAVIINYIKQPQVEGLGWSLTSVGRYGPSGSVCCGQLLALSWFLF